MAPKPKLLMLDEPFLGLAPNLVGDVFEKIMEINRETGVSVLFSRRSLHFWAKSALWRRRCGRFLPSAKEYIHSN
jgi:ABC-type branched-subunit amino acid transport system ATPase component